MLVVVDVFANHANVFTFVGVIIIYLTTSQMLLYALFIGTEKCIHAHALNTYALTDIHSYIEYSRRFM